MTARNNSVASAQNAVSHPVKRACVCDPASLCNHCHACNGMTREELINWEADYFAGKVV